jgi:hypothetical protein
MNEQERIRKKMVVAYFKALSKESSPGKTEKNHENLRSG